jgi:hypothetical protein
VNQLTFQRWDCTITFKRNLQNRWRPRQPEHIDMIVPFIDGVAVKDLLGHDGYAGLPSNYVEPHATHWDGPPNYGDDGRWAIIDGGCGVVGCCGVEADITFETDTVRWSHFTIGQQDTDQREYTFDRAAYAATIDAIPRLHPIAVTEKW